MKHLPEIIWIYWHQGWENAPEVVLKCLDSWRVFNPEYTINALSSSDVDSYIDLKEIIPSRRLSKMSVVAKSDVIRIHLLEKYGGIWVDSTLFCRRPLKEWLHQNESDFFAFDKPGPDRLISVWFLASSQKGTIVTKWASAARKYWNEWQWRRIYYWPHKVFKDLYRRDKTFKIKWDEAPKISADGPHFFVPFKENFFKPHNEGDVDLLSQLDPPVIKLTYKCLKNGYPKGSLIDYILNNYMSDLRSRKRKKNSII